MAIVVWGLMLFVGLLLGGLAGAAGVVAVGMLALGIHAASAAWSPRPFGPGES